VSPLRRLRQFRAPGTGRHRLVRAPERIKVTLSGLSQPYPPQFIEAPAHGAIAPQAFRHCTPCGGDVAVLLHHSGAHTCDSGHLTLPTTIGEG
jgi:hypothetical protein